MSLEEFELAETITQSTRTIVRRAVRKSDGTRVIVKTLVNEYPTRHELEQLESEYAVLRKLADSPHVIGVHSFERDHDRPMLVLEDFGGDPLLQNDTPGVLPFDRFFEVVTAVIKGLHSIHALNVIHRDIKPGNIIVNQRTKDVKLIDFDVALDLSEPRREDRDTFEGSLPYMSPEQTGRMNRELDYRADYYSLGITLFELLTGTLPFKASDTMGWVHCHISRVAPSVSALNPAVPESLDRIVRKLMDKNPDDRYQSAHGLLRDLERSERQSRDGGQDAGFVLGAHDISQRFQVSPRLYGRAIEIARILGAFAAASRGSRELVLLTGGAGVGKTATVREVERQIVSTHGRFVSGHIDQRARAVPYSTFVQVLRRLAKQLLTQPDDQLAAWRRKLNHAIAPSGQVLLDLVPELEQVIGPQPPVPTLLAEEAHSRFRTVVQSFVGAIARPESPLALFFDDLQWADASTLDLLASLVSSAEVGHLLVIAAFRDSDSSGGESDQRGAAIPPALKQAQGAKVQTITLGPLSEHNLLEMVLATTRAEPQSDASLAAIVHHKTGGNPFFVHELLNTLALQGAFHLNVAEGRWDWDREAIQNASVSDNVVDLMVNRLKGLQPGTAKIICLGACIGESFDLDTLTALAGSEPVGEALREAVAQRMLIPGIRGTPSGSPRATAAPSSASYSFQHSRLHQAAYSMLDGDECARAHLDLGRRLWAACVGTSADNTVFEIATHMNRGRLLIVHPNEQHRLAELNVVAAKRARQSTAHSIAADHLHIAMQLLATLPPTQADKELAKQRFEVARMHAECVFLAGDIEGAQRLAGQLAATAPEAMSAAAAQFLVARTFDYHGRYAEEIDVIREALGRVGIELPRDMAEIDRRIGEGIGRMQAYLAQHPVEELVHLPQMVDAEKIMAMDLLFQLIPPAIQTCPPLFVLAELIMFDLGTTFGVTVASAKNFVDCGIIQGGILGDYATAHRLGKVAFELVKQYSPAPLEAGVNFVFANFVSHWRAPYREGLEAFKRAKKIGRELGNLGHTAYAYALETQRLFLAGVPLDTCAEAVREAHLYLGQIHARGTLPAVATVAQAIGRLQGQPVDPSTPIMTEAESQVRMRESKNGPFMFAHSQAEAMCSFLLGDLAAAVRWDAITTSMLRASVGIFSVADHHLFQGLILCRRWPSMSAEEQAAAAPILDQNLAKLANWASNCPENFAPKHRLLAAEIGRVRGGPLEEILASFDEAVAAAGDDFPQMRALANELQAEFWLGRGQRKLARALMHEAHYLYGVWGARAKVRQIEHAHPEWFAVAPASQFPMTDSAARNTVFSGSLDLASAMKATRAISGEVTRERLYARLMTTIVENAGAQRGCLMVLSESGAIEVVSRVNEEGQPQHSIAGVTLEESGGVCVEMVRFVARTGEAVVLDDASQHPTYGNDPYIRKSGARSILCMPILHQGRILAILYVENSAVTHAFAFDRQQLLQLIASQAAVSISNARLYDILEEKVAARTRELAARNVDLEQAHGALTNEMKTRQAMEIELRQAQKLEAVGRLASGVAHELNTPIQFVTDSVQFLRDGMTDLVRFVDTLRAVQRLVAAGEPAIEAAAAAAEAEESLDLGYLIENMPPAFERSLDGLERVATIVRSMKEFAHPDAKQMVAVDLNRAIESTLTMARNEYKFVADVEVDFAQIPLVLCHAGEVNQAILNIVVNAAHAIEDVVKGTDRRGRISLRTRQEGERVLIEIEDTGAGIPEAIRDRIFDPFFTTKEVGRGSGQGLAIARSVLVEKHGGELTCRSEAGKGTIFSLRLPIEGKRDAVASTKAA